MSDEKIRLDPKAIDLESLDVEELEQVAGGAADGTNNNCYSCTCPTPPQPVLVAAE